MCSEAATAQGHEFIHSLLFEIATLAVIAQFCYLPKRAGLELVSSCLDSVVSGGFEVEIMQFMPRFCGSGFEHLLFAFEAIPSRPKLSGA